MTTLPTTARPAVAAPARPAHVSAPSSAPALDPIKLLKKHKWTLIGAATIGAILGTIAHIVLVQVYPIYAPFAILRCSALQNDIGSQIAAPGSTYELKQFMATEVQILTSDSTVDATLSDPNFPREAPKWSAPFMNGGVLDKDRAARALKRNLSAGVLGESSLIQVKFWWTDSEEATSILRQIRRTYQTQRSRFSVTDLNERQDKLQRSIRETENTIAAKQLARQRFLQEQNADSLEQANATILGEIRSLQERITEARQNIELLNSRRKQMEAELESPTGPTYSGEVRKAAEEDTIYVQMTGEINRLRDELEAARLRLGDQHRTVIQMQTLLDTKIKNRDVELDRLLRQNFNAMLDVTRNNIISLGAAQDDLLKQLEAKRIKANELTQTIAKIHDLDSEIQRLTDSSSKLNDAAKSVQILGANQSRIELVQDAQPPKSMSFPKIYVMVPAGMFLLLALVGGVIVFLEVIDQRVKGPSDIAAIPRTRVLGLIPHASEDPAAPQKIETVFRDQPAGVMAEAYRQLRGTILKRMHTDGLKSLLLLSAMPGSGSTSVASNLAFALASADLKVLLIDANFRRPSIHRVLGLAEVPGLADVLAGNKTLADAAQQTENPRVHVLSAGTQSARLVERLATEPMGKVLREATSAYDLVLVDVAPAQIAGDALSLANRCDASMLVVRAFGEKRGMVARLRNELSDSKAEFLGVVINAVRSLAGGYLKGNILATHHYQNGKGGKD